MKLYKIRDTKTGMYSKGGCDCTLSDRHWSKLGKTWSRLSFVKAHLGMYVKVPRSWEVVEYEVAEVRSFPVANLGKEEL